MVKVRNLDIGRGIPKICVPIPCQTQAEILDTARKIAGENGKSAADMVEWRADWYEDVFLPEKVEETGQALREILGNMPVLFTFRTMAEGGAKRDTVVPLDDYAKLNLNAIETGLFDLLDIELSAGDERVRQVVDWAHKNDVKVIVSSHNYKETPVKDEIVSCLCRMQDLGADIPKVSVMPRSNDDVMTLLDATREMNMNYADRPIIAISMGKLGSMTRVVGEIYGSAITFAAMGKASAPGQMDAENLKETLLLIHGSQGNL